MTAVQVPALSLARLRAKFADFQTTAQTVVEAMGYAEVQGVNLNLEQGVLELPDGSSNEQLTGRQNGEIEQPLGAV